MDCSFFERKEVVAESLHRIKQILKKRTVLAKINGFQKF